MAGRGGKKGTGNGTASWNRAALWVPDRNAYTNYLHLIYLSISEAQQGHKIICNTEGIN